MKVLINTLDRISLRSVKNSLEAYRETFKKGIKRMTNFPFVEVDTQRMMVLKLIDILGVLLCVSGLFIPSLFFPSIP